MHTLRNEGLFFTRDYMPHLLEEIEKGVAVPADVRQKRARPSRSLMDAACQSRGLPRAFAPLAGVMYSIIPRPNSLLPYRGYPFL